MPSTPEPAAAQQGSRDVGAASDECRKNASKNRKENDWFGHDATAPTGSRSSTTSGTTSGTSDSRPRSAASAPRTPNRTARESEDWFRYDVNGTQKTTTSGSGGSGPDVTSAKLRVLHGTQQDWYKHGSDVPDPPSMERQSKTRSRKSACAESRHKGTDPNEWFRHDHARGSGTGTAPGSGSSRPSKKPAKDVASPTSLWVVYSEDGSPVNPSDATPRTRSRLTASEADEYYRRDKVGSSADWFSHDHPRDETPTSVSGQTSRMRGSAEGGEIADRLKGESEDWFSHDGNRNYVSPLPVGKGHSPLAKELMERAQGSEIRQVFHMEENLRATWNTPPPLLGPDVDDVVQVQGSSSSNDDRDVENVREKMEKALSNGQSKKKEDEEEEKTAH